MPLHVRPPLRDDNPWDLPPLPPSGMNFEEIIRGSIPGSNSEPPWNPFEHNYFQTPEGPSHAGPGPWRNWESGRLSYEDHMFRKHQEQLQDKDRMDFFFPPEGPGWEPKPFPPDA
jgi:hypothetical protein